MYAKLKDIQAAVSLTVLLSLFIHMVIMVSLLLPDFSGLMELQKMMEGSSTFGDRDIIVNINQDDQREINRTTLLSDRDSTAQGYITRKKGDRWLNNSLDFKMSGGGNSTEDRKAVDAKKGKDSPLLLADESEVMINITREQPSVSETRSGNNIEVKIPDKNNVTRENAIFYSNRGLFSFNTAKFQSFKYFKEMKDKIAGNWYPPLMANAIIGGANPITGTYAPGSTRILAIPSQEVKLYFAMNRKGDILEVQILESYGNKSLDSSCLDAIRLSKTFGPVPEEIKGEIIVIPFIFGYYAY
jgi:TonB family protein